MLRIMIMKPGHLVLLALWLLSGTGTNSFADEAPSSATATDAGHSTAGQPDHGTGDHGGQPNILEPQIPLAFWTLVVFLLLLFVLWRFAWGPLSKALHDREHNHQQILAATEKARADAEHLLAEHRKLMDQANQQAQAILDQARKAAQSTSDEIRRTAQTEAEATLDRARREIESARDQALMEVWGRAADLVVTTTGKVLARELNDDDHRRLIEVARSELPSAARGNGSRHGQS